jgi:hypothetical protein
MALFAMAALALVLLYAGLVFAARNHYVVTAPGGSVFSGATDGSRVWFDYLASLGLKPRIMQQFDELPPTNATLVAAPPFPRAVTRAEAAALKRWVETGGRLVLVGADVPSLGGLATGAGATDHGTQGPPPPGETGRTQTVTPIMPAPFADGVERITVGAGRVLADGPDWVTHFKDMQGQILISRALGRGEVVWLADPYPTTNAGIGKSDNARLATLLASRGGPVYFDEYHHGYVSGGGFWDRLPDGGRVALLFAAAAVAIALVTASRRLGPPVPEPARPASRTTEWLVPLAELFRKAGARAEALASLSEGLKRTLTGNHGSLAAGLTARPEAAAALADADSQISGTERPSRESFIRTARRLVRARQEVERR